MRDAGSVLCHCGQQAYLHDGDLLQCRSFEQATVPDLVEIANDALERAELALRQAHVEECGLRDPYLNETRWSDLRARCTALQVLVRESGHAWLLERHRSRV